MLLNPFEQKYFPDRVALPFSGEVPACPIGSSLSCPPIAGEGGAGGAVSTAVSVVTGAEAEFMRAAPEWAPAVLCTCSS